MPNGPGKKPPADGLDVKLPEPDPRYEVVDDQIQEALRFLAGLIDSAIKGAGSEKKLGFALFIFEFDPGNSVFYISSGQRADVAKMVREWFQREGGQ